MDNRAVFRAVEAIYETIDSETLWPDALQSIAIALSAKGAAICVRETNGNSRAFASSSLKAALREYSTQWKQQDIIAQRAATRAQTLAASASIYTEQDFVTTEEIFSHPYFRDFSKRHGLGSIIRGELLPTEVHPGALIVRRPLGAPPFNPNDIETFGELKKHCERSLQLAAELRHRNLTNARTVHATDMMGFALVFLDARGRLLPGADVPAEWTTDALRSTGGMLDPVDHEARRALRVAISSAIESAGKTMRPNSRSILIPRTNGGRPLIAYITSASSQEAAPHQQTHQRAAVVVAILDLAAAPTIDNDILRGLGLTTSEARIAALIGTGCSPRETADRLAIAEGTVRTSLKRIYAKTGTSRQSELAALLSRLALMGIRLPNR